MQGEVFDQSTNNKPAFCLPAVSLSISSVQWTRCSVQVKLDLFHKMRQQLLGKENAQLIFFPSSWTAEEMQLLYVY